MEKLQEKLSKTYAKDEKKMVEKKINRIQDKVNLKASQIDFLESEINRLEQLNMDSFKVDNVTKTTLINALELIEEKYETDKGFHSALIDFQSEEIIVFLHPNSGLTVEKFETDTDYEAYISVVEGEHGPISCASRDGTCRSPLYAGVEIKRNNDSGGPGTLGYYAVHDSGARGFVTAGHIADFDGASIKQPENGRVIGQVTEYCGQSVTSCDGAFVDLGSGETSSNRIYKTSSSYYNVIGETADSGQTLGKFVRKSGIATDVTYGSIVGNVPGNNYNTIKFNSGNWIAGGDSGSPVFQQPSTRSNNVYLHGLLVGQAGNGQYGLYHPQDFLADQLDLR